MLVPAFFSVDSAANNSEQPINVAVNRLSICNPLGEVIKQQ
jgi:hypothetical protein